MNRGDDVCKRPHSWTGAGCDNLQHLILYNIISYYIKVCYNTNMILYHNYIILSYYNVIMSCYVCIYIYICMYIYIYIYIYILPRLPAPRQARRWPQPAERVHRARPRNTYIYIYVSLSICMYIYVYIYIYTHMISNICSTCNECSMTHALS